MISLGPTSLYSRPSVQGFSARARDSTGRLHAVPELGLDLSVTGLGGATCKYMYINSRRTRVSRVNWTLTSVPSSCFMNNLLDTRS